EHLYGVPALDEQAHEARSHEPRPAGHQHTLQRHTSYLPQSVGALIGPVSGFMGLFLRQPGRIYRKREGQEDFLGRKNKETFLPSPLPVPLYRQRSAVPLADFAISWATRGAFGSARGASRFDKSGGFRRPRAAAALAPMTSTSPVAPGTATLRASSV